MSIAVEGCTGWRYVVEEVVAAGFEAHLAEPADTQAARGRKRRAKTDRSDCRLLRELLADGRLPASWIAPTIVLEWRERARLYKTLVDQRSTWVQRIHAELYQHGVTLPETSIRWAKTRELLEDDGLEISPAGRQRVLTAYRMIDAITVESRPLKADLQRFGSASAGLSGVGRQPVRDRWAVGGGDVVRARRLPTLHPLRAGRAPQRPGRDRGPSDRRRAGGFMSRQGPQTLRWALYEAAKNASHQRSPDHDYYVDVKDHLNGKLATISMARKLARRCFHVLRAVDPDVVYATP